MYELPLKFSMYKNLFGWRNPKAEADAIAYHSIDREEGPMTDSIHAAVKTDSVLIQQAIEQQASRLAENGHVSEAPRLGS